MISYQEPSATVYRGHALEKGAKVLSDYERGWLDAMIDGEGSLSLTYGRQRTSPRPRIDIRIDISNTNRALLEKAQMIIGGGSISCAQHTGNRKPHFRLCIRANKIREILPQLHLIAKAKQCGLLLEAAALIQGFGKGSRQGFQGGKMRPLWKDERFAEIKEELNRLNKRGRPTINASLLVETHIQKE